MATKRKPPRQRAAKAPAAKAAAAPPPTPRKPRTRKREDTRSRESLADELTATALEAARAGGEPNPLADEIPAEDEHQAPALPCGAIEAPPPTRAASNAGADLFALVEKKLRGRVEVPGLGKRRRKKVAMNAAADAYVMHMVLGSYKFDRDFLDRALGKPVQRLQVGRDAVAELREWLTEPGPAQLGLGVELARLLSLAKGLRSAAGRQVAEQIEGLLASVGAGSTESPATPEAGAAPAAPPDPAT